MLHLVNLFLFFSLHFLFLSSSSPPVCRFLRAFSWFSRRSVYCFRSLSSAHPFCFILINRLVSLILCIISSIISDFFIRLPFLYTFQSLSLYRSLVFAISTLPLTSLLLLFYYLNIFSFSLSLHLSFISFSLVNLYFSVLQLFNLSLSSLFPYFIQSNSTMHPFFSLTYSLVLFFTHNALYSCQYSSSFFTSFFSFFLSSPFLCLLFMVFCQHPHFLF